MLMNILTFNRYELKYLLNREQYFKLMQIIEPRLIKDKHGISSIQSLYYDTNDFRLIRRSLQKPDYKEKLRLRSYGKAKDGDTVFIELKKKCDGIVYKRRAEYQYSSIQDITFPSLASNQIQKEIEYFIHYYPNLDRRFLLIYDRQAYFGENSLRVTFDDNIRYRTEDLTLNQSLDGKRLLDDNLILMEIKTSTSIPLWLSKGMSENEIKKTSFSKYGRAYQDYIKGGKHYEQLIQ